MTSSYSVGALLDLQGHLEAQRFGGLEIDHQLEFGRPLDGQFSRLVAFEDSRCRAASCLSPRLNTEILLPHTSILERCARHPYVRFGQWQTCALH